MMKKKGIVISAAAVILSIVHIIAGAAALSRLPETVPTHFNSEWICDGVGSRWTLLIFAALPLVFSLVILVTAYRQTKQHRITAVIMLPLAVFLGAFFWMGYPTFQSGAAIGDKVDSAGLAFVLPLGFSVLLVIIGNYMPLIQPNKLMGIRLPSTLKNPQCWRLTHRFAGRLMCVSGLLMSLLVVLAHLAHHSGDQWLMILFGAVVIANAVAQIVYAGMHRNAA